MMLFSNCQGHILRSPWQFSADFLEQQDEKPQPHSWLTLEHPKQETLPSAPKQASWFTVNNAHKIINIATLMYACIKIYKRYQQIDATTPPSEGEYMLMKKLKQLMLYVCPQFIQTIGSHGVFFIDSVEIIFKALIYKTLAQLVVLCGSGNIFDLIGYGLQKAAHLVL